MAPIRVLVGLITLAYAAWLLLEGMLGATGLYSPLPPKLIAMLGAYMQLGPQPVWRPVVELVAGLVFGIAATRIMGSPRGAWRVFFFAAVLSLIARWAAPLLASHTVATAKSLAMGDKMLLIGLGIGLLLYLALGQVKRKRVLPTVLNG